MIRELLNAGKTSGPGCTKDQDGCLFVRHFLCLLFFLELGFLVFVDFVRSEKVLPCHIPFWNVLELPGHLSGVLWKLRLVQHSIDSCCSQEIPSLDYLDSTAPVIF